MYQEYIVKKFDTLTKIADKFNTKVEEIKKINNLNDDLIYIGQKLYVPLDDEIYVYYTAMPGENVENIAKYFCTQRENIIIMNKLNSNIIQEKTTLKIPLNPEKAYVYTIKPGDTLYQIARDFNTSVDKIKIINNLKSNTIYPGNKLVIII